MPTPLQYANQTSAIRPLDGMVPGLSWDQFIQNFSAPTGAQQFASGANVAGLGTVGVNRNTGHVMGSSGGEAGSGDGNPFGSYQGGWTEYAQPVGDGTQNVFSRDATTGGVTSKNETINNDGWWDATGFPILATFAVGGLAAAGGAFAGAGGAAGAGGVAAGDTSVGGLAALDSAAVASEGAAPGLLTGAGLSDIPVNVASGFGGGDGFLNSAYGSAGGEANSVGGLAELDSAAVGAEGATPGLTTGYGAAPWYQQPGLGSSLGSLTSSGGSNPISSIANILSGNGSGADYWSALSSGGSLLSGILGSNAASHAADAQTNAANQSNALAAAIYGNNTALNAPFVQAGTGAVGQMANLNGLNGAAAQTTAQGQFKTDPGYQFAVDESNRALQNSASAAGGLYSGRAAKAVIANTEGLANQQYGNYYNRLSGLAGLGQASANQQAANGNNYSNSVSGNNAAIGNAQAAGTIGSTNAITNSLSQLFGNYGSNQLMQQLLRQNGSNGYYGATGV